MEQQVYEAMKRRAASIDRFLALGMVSLSFVLAPARQAWGYNLISAEQEASMGAEAFEQLKKEKKALRTGPQVAQVNRVSARLQSVVSVPHAKWEFVVFEDATPNAFALPGGKVGVHSGLFQVVENEAQLAAVIGHELAHVTLRHAGKRLSRNAVRSTLGTIAGMVLQRKTGIDGDTAQKMTRGAVTLSVLQFSRTQEFEADRTGAIYMAKAGYDPREAINLWKRMGAWKAKAGGTAPPTFLSSHPLDERRIQELQAIMPEALSYYKGSAAAPAPAAVPATPGSSVPKAIRFQQ